MVPLLPFERRKSSLIVGTSILVHFISPGPMTVYDMDKAGLELPGLNKPLPGNTVCAVNEGLELYYVTRSFLYPWAFYLEINMEPGLWR